MSLELDGGGRADLTGSDRGTATTARADQPRLVAAFEALPSASRAALRAAVINRATLTELADELKVSPIAAGALVHRARSQLRDLLVDDAADDASPACATHRPRTVAYISDRLSEREQRIVEDHLAVCASCRAVVDLAGDIDGSLRATFATERVAAAPKRRTLVAKPVIAAPLAAAPLVAPEPDELDELGSDEWVPEDLESDEWVPEDLESDEWVPEDLESDEPASGEVTAEEPAPDEPADSLAWAPAWEGPAPVEPAPDELASDELASVFALHGDAFDVGDGPEHAPEIHRAAFLASTRARLGLVAATVLLVGGATALAGALLGNSDSSDKPGIVVAQQTTTTDGDRTTVTTSGIPDVVLTDGNAIPNVSGGGNASSTGSTGGSGSDGMSDSSGHGFTIGSGGPTATTAHFGTTTTTTVAHGSTTTTAPHGTSSSTSTTLGTTTSTTQPPTPSADLKISRTAQKIDSTTFRIVVTLRNDGPSNAAAPSVTVTRGSHSDGVGSPSYGMATSAPSDWGCGGSATSRTCSSGVIADGETVQLTFTITVPVLSSGSYTLSCTSSTDDPDAASNASAVTWA
jgi:hypothetical protein